jgi:hypothetical protein
MGVNMLLLLGEEALETTSSAFGRGTNYLPPWPLIKMNVNVTRI